MEGYSLIDLRPGQVSPRGENGGGHPTAPSHLGIGQSDQGGVRPGQRCRAAEGNGNLVFVGSGIYETGRNECRGRRAADPGPAVNQKRPIPGPPVEKLEQRSHVGCAGDDEMVFRIADIVDLKPQVPPLVPVPQVRKGPFRIEQTDDPSRLVKGDHLLHPGERTYENCRGTTVAPVTAGRRPGPQARRTSPETLA